MVPGPLTRCSREREGESSSSGADLSRHALTAIRFRYDYGTVFGQIVWAGSDNDK